jgi:hypothetical protein
MGLRGPKATGKARTSTERVRRHRQQRRQVITAGDDYDERRAVIKACTALVERLKDILESPPAEHSSKVALWRLGLEQAIAAIEEYRGEVRDLLV